MPEDNLTDVEFGPDHRGWIPGPVWPDGCDHDEGSYVGSFQIYRWNKTEADLYKFDLYVFNQPCGQKVCIRYGAEGHEYISPGRLIDFIKRAGDDWASCLDNEYVKALEMLEEKGIFNWHPTVVKTVPANVLPLAA